jgi:hypothetical protein
VDPLVVGQHKDNQVLFILAYSLFMIEVRYGTVRCGAVRYGTVRYGTVRYGTVRYGAVRCGTVRYGTVRYGTGRSRINYMPLPLTSAGS